MYEGTLYRVFFCLVSLGVVDAYPCSGALTVSSSRVVVKYGDPVEVNCTANVHHYGMGWEATIGSKPMDEDVQVMVWSIYRVWDWEVETRCYVNLEDGETQCIEEVAVVVYKDLTFAPTLSVNHHGPLAEGATYLLQCHVQDVAPARYLDVTWYKGDAVMPSANPLHSSYPSSPSNVTASLWITPMREDNGAQFRCEAGLRLGEGGPQPPPPRMASASLGITVHYGPVLYNCSNGELHVPEGETLESYCTARGNPSPTVTWRQYRNGDLVDPRQPLSRADRGKYSYSVTGGVQSKHLLLTIEVLYGPEILCRSNFSVEEYKRYEPPCAVVGFPPPDVQWFKEGEEVVLPERLSRADQGRYYILAGSKHGVADHWLELRVLYPPTPIVELEDTEVYALGSDATLKCSSTGDPRPQYRWSYFQEENVRVNTEDGVSLLHINRVSGLNIGTYTCCAFNRLGEVCRAVRVTVRGVQASCPIKFSSAGQSVEKLVVEYDNNVSVNCDAKGHTKKQWISPEAAWTEKTITDWNIQPVCEAEFEGLAPCDKPLQLILYKSPKSVSLNVPSYSGGPLVNNENYTLLCEVQDVAPVKNLVITWYRQRLNSSVRIDTFQNNDIRTPQDVNSTLVINATRLEDGARYWCEAKLDLGEETPKPMRSRLFHAIVHYAPVITQPNASVVPVFRDYQEVLVCEAEGNPKPTITWSFHNKTVYGGNLTINMDMVGEITCLAVNNVNQTIKIVQLVFKGVAASECPVEISPPSLVVRYGESALATCHALVPIEGMGWESTVGPVNMEEGVERLNWTVEELREWTVGPLCYINPKDGDQCFEKLPVLVYQMPESVTLTVSGAESKYTERSYNLFCKVENFAPAENVTVRWFKGDTLVKQSSEKQDDPAKVGLRNRTFEMTTSFQPSDDGVEFHCEVGLDLTPDPVMKSQAVRITVHYAPKHEWTEEPLLLDADTVLDCTANGNPDPVYEWTSTSVTEKLDGRPVHKVTTAGNYTCTASNGLGSSVKHFTVLSKSAGEVSLHSQNVSSRQPTNLNGRATMTVEIRAGIFRASIFKVTLIGKLVDLRIIYYG